MDNLKLCPFCNKADRVRIYTDSMARFGELLWIKYSVRCNRCRIETPTYATKAAAIRKWNKRPAEDALKAEMDRMKAALKDMCGLWESMGTQIPPLLNEQKYLNAKLLGGGTNVPTDAPDTDVGNNESEVEDV